MLFNPLSKDRENSKNSPTFSLSPLSITIDVYRSSKSISYGDTILLDSLSKTTAVFTGLEYGSIELVPRWSWRVAEGGRTVHEGDSTIESRTSGGGEWNSMKGEEGGESGVDLEDRKGGSFRSIGFPDCHWEAPPFHQKKNDPWNCRCTANNSSFDQLLEYLLSRRIFFLSSRCFFARFFPTLWLVGKWASGNLNRSEIFLILIKWKVVFVDTMETIEMIVETIKNSKKNLFF